MIIVKFTGGLGNQLFQYALFCALQEKYEDTEILADTSAYYVLDLHYGFEIDKIFQLSENGNINIATKRQLYSARREIPYFVGGAIGKIVQVPTDWINARIRQNAENKGIRNVIREEDLIWNRDSHRIKSVIDNLDITKNWYLDGYWQEEIYFEHVMDKVKMKCSFPELQSIQEMELETQIVHSNSVGVHVRRGDYVNSFYDILGIDYYRNAFEYIKKRVDNPTFFIFSEDAKYVKEAFSWLENKTIVSFNTGKDSYKDMQFMSMCKHNIIANSSFSTWAAYLNRNEDKTVIYPSQYTKSSLSNKRKGWIEIHV